MRCRHPEYRRARTWLIDGPFPLGTHAATVDLCLDCGAWLSLGPSNDAPPEVQIEIRAAEAAEDYRTAAEPWFSGFSDEECRGWSLAETNMQEHTDEYQTGYLARCIATHKDGEP